ncbi:Transcriptional regulator, contains XRE-family HTH domain [Actinopolyspora xinjiangensis]|uniref:Transcriptional regulator, contains XRE-family HTH domain n=2 Tax=Actinopolyspora xinjiangensis TaxID=405564 RepID=A0A1H0W174_9ACTN|nr:Transcriptional regulator, contains XRE-family HTH domain [Actinopolyspora xinjiangensis]
MLWCMAGTTPKARALGAELRSAREAAGMGLRQLADLLETSHATVSRWETGQRAPKPEDVTAYLATVGGTAEQREQLADLARDPDGSHWLSVGMPEQHRQLATLLEIEREASRITTVSPLLIPGLLQTADYARAIMTTGGVPASEIDTRVAVRIGRHDAIVRKNPAHLRAFIGEGVLNQLIGDSEIMVDQLRALLKYAELDNVELRVIPTRCGWHPGLEGPFSLAEFDGTRSPVVHLENRVSALFLHESDEVQAYLDALDRVREVAMSPAESVGTIGDAINETESTQ